MYIIYIHTYVYTIVEHKCWQHLSISAFLKISVIFCPAFPEALQVAKREMGTRPSNTFDFVRQLFVEFCWLDNCADLCRLYLSLRF